MQHIILHIDFDSFFASVEQQHNPLFRNKPLGVTATNGRNCIIASSREAKRLGIGTGSRVHEARRLCPTLLLTPADFVKYWEISKKFIAICKDYSPFVEVFSIDELFMDVTRTVYLFGGLEELVKRIKQRIRTEIGEYITVSIGISHNKLLAKLASGLKKPNGVVRIYPDAVDEVYQHAQLTDICGIGERIKSRLNSLGIYTLLQLQKAPLSSLVAEFGNVEGMFLRNIGFGIDPRPVLPYTQVSEVKSVGRNYCLPHNEYDKRLVLQNFYELCEEVGIKLRRLHKVARTVGFSFRGTNNLYGRKTYNTYIDTGKEIYYECLPLIDRDYFSQGYTRQMGIWVSNLEDKDHTPRSLFDYKSKQDRLISIIDQINEKFGDYTIRNGFLLYADKLTTVPNGYMADKFERSKLAVEGV